MDDGDSTATAGAIDHRAFMEQMVPHHRSAIAMAEMALERAEHPEVRRLARAIVSAQETETSEMQAMQEWRERWYPPLG